MTPPPVLHPPTLPTGPPPDPRVPLWVTGSILTVVGVFMALFDNPYVPLSQVFQLIPLSLGAAVGVAVLRERHRVAGIVAMVLVVLWLLWQVLSNFTSPSPMFLFAGVTNLARAVIKSVRED